MQSDLTIGSVAKLAGIHVETIRYYQRRGLLTKPDKRTGAYRQYPAEIVKRIHFIKRAQVLGFTLEEVGELLDLSEANTCAETRELAMHKIALINQKMADLAAMQHVLADLVTKCDTNQVDSSCPIIMTLTEE